MRSNRNTHVWCRINAHCRYRIDGRFWKPRHRMDADKSDDNLGGWWNIIWRHIHAVPDGSDWDYGIQVANDNHNNGYGINRIRFK